jgi:hypothetical protein
MFEVDLELSAWEVGILRAAVREVLSTLEDPEFHTRMGVTREEAEAALATLDAVATDVVTALLRDGLDDLITFGQVYSRVLERLEDPTDEQLMTKCETIVEMVSAGFAIIGDPKEVGAMVVISPWDLSTDEVAERLRNRWSVLREERAFAGEGWMELTTLGREEAIARSLDS